MFQIYENGEIQLSEQLLFAQKKAELILSRKWIQIWDAAFLSESDTKFIFWTEILILILTEILMFDRKRFFL